MERGEHDMTLIPIENSIGGRVAEIHHLLFNTELKITAEYCLCIEHCLMIRPESDLSQITAVRSHPQALLQCRQFVHDHKIRAVAELDTAMAARWVKEEGGRGDAAIASSDCAAIYELKVARRGIANHINNITRFIAMCPHPSHDSRHTRPVSALLFQLRSVPAALYKALGGFATNGINILKLESYVDPQGFGIAQFYAEIAADINATSSTHALEELQYFAEWVRVIGIFQLHRTPIKTD